MKSKSLICSILLLLLCSTFAKAQFSPKKIASEYSQAVVKILMYDPVLDRESDLDGILSRGSGFIVSEDGYIFTNRHVISWGIHGYWIADCMDSNGKEYPQQFIAFNEARSFNEQGIIFTHIHHVGVPVPIIQIFTGKGPEDYVLYQSEILSYSESYDGAVLKIISDLDGNIMEKNHFTSVPTGNSDQAMQGEQVCVLGFPAQHQDDWLLDRSTLTIGYHSGWDYVFDHNYGMIKTDADINSGNSGGPAFGEKNSVIGIASATGIQTGIGLLSGINGMYYVTAPYPEFFTSMSQRGLTPPERANAIMVLKYTRPELPTAEQFNQAIAENSDAQAPPSGEKVQVSAKVISADSGKPLKKAKGGLAIINEETGEYEIISSGKADRSGIIVFSPKVYPGDYLIIVTADKYERISVIITIEESNKNFEVTLGRAR